MKTGRKLDIVRRTRRLVRSGSMPAVVALLAVVVALGSTACSYLKQQEAAKEVPATPEELLVELQEQKDRLDQATNQMLEKIAEFNDTRMEGERTVQFGELFTDELSDEQRDILDQMLAEEQDISYRSLLGRIITDRDLIRNLQAKILQLEKSLPEQFVVVAKGNTHYSLAREYLTNQAGLPKDKVGDLVSRADLTDELATGNKVWFFYDEERDNLGTYVTQGDADRMPIAIRRALKRKLISDRDAAIATAGTFESERDAARAAVGQLERVKAGLEADIAQLRRNKATLESEVSRLSNDLSFQKNTLFYHAASVTDLKEQGVLSRVLKRFEDVRGINFDAALDLRRGSTIRLDPEEFGLEKIRRVRLLPGVYEEGRDFTIETFEQSGFARIVILDSSLFRGKEVLVAVGG
jgi:hypothetical protein